jgi:hypothetical protein
MQRYVVLKSFPAVELSEFTSTHCVAGTVKALVYVKAFHGTVILSSKRRYFWTTVGASHLEVGLSHSVGNMKAGSC